MIFLHLGTLVERSFCSLTHGPAVAMPVASVTVPMPSAPTVRVPVLVEQAQPQQVDHQPHDAHVQDHERVVDVLWLVEPLQGLHRDGEAQRHWKETFIFRSVAKWKK